MPGVSSDTAYAIGHSELKVLDGAARVANWTPDADIRLSPQAQRLAELVMEDDAQMHAALAEALMLSQEQGQDGGKTRRRQQEVARFAASRLARDARIAAFSLNGWDTHRRQDAALPRSLKQLSDTILTLRDDLGPQVWGQTAVVAVTEFGRTARENGTLGTDHGTAGLMLMAGGAVRGGKVHGAWPGVDESALYQRRDLMPMRDVRAPLAWILRAVTGADRATLERHVFPGLDMGTDPGLLV
jgi:uncharacterized protein (DUF1501 family)